MMPRAFFPAFFAVCFGASANVLPDNCEDTVFFNYFIDFVDRVIEETGNTSNASNKIRSKILSVRHAEENETLGIYYPVDDEPIIVAYKGNFEIVPKGSNRLRSVVRELTWSENRSALLKKCTIANGAIHFSTIMKIEGVTELVIGELVEQVIYGAAVSPWVESKLILPIDGRDDCPKKCERHTIICSSSAEPDMVGTENLDYDYVFSATEPGDDCKIELSYDNDRTPRIDFKHESEKPWCADQTKFTIAVIFITIGIGTLTGAYWSYKFRKTMKEVRLRNRYDSKDSTMSDITSEHTFRDIPDIPSESQSARDYKRCLKKQSVMEKAKRKKKPPLTKRQVREAQLAQMMNET